MVRMALYRYEKSSISYSSSNNQVCKSKLILLEEDGINKKQEDAVVSSYYHISHAKRKAHSTNTALIVRNILGVFLLIIASILILPFAAFYVNQIFSQQFNQSFLSPIAADSVTADSSIGIANPFQISSTPNSTYFQNAAQSANKGSDKDGSDGIDSSYTGQFSVSVPSVNLVNVPVQANVVSTDNSYLQVLNHSLAHFKGTALPGEKGNVFIYGHSSVEWYASLFPHSFLAIFTPLIHVNIGEKITINFRGKDYTYDIYRTKIIAPNDFSALDGIKGENTVTLMTCVPPGIGTQRLIVQGVQEN